MSRLSVPRILATGSLLSAATSLRAGAGVSALVVARAPRLFALALRASAGENAGRRQAEFRDELLGLARETAELSWREMRRGIEALDRSTRNGDAGGAARPHRVKP